MLGGYDFGSLRLLSRRTNIFAKAGPPILQGGSKFPDTFVSSSADRDHVLHRYPKCTSPNVLLVLGLVLLGGCASPMPSGKPPAARGAPVTLAENQSVVFGRIAQLRDGKEVDWETGPAFLGPGGHLVFVLSAQTGTMQPDGDRRRRTLHLAACTGEYTIAAISLDHVPRGFCAIMGKLPDRACRRSRLHRQSANAGDRARYDFDIEDRLDSEVANLGTRMAAPLPPVIRWMVQFEPSVGTFSSLWSICGPRGGVTCDRTWQGLEPLKPDGTARSFVGVDNLAPLLEWKPAARENLRYDLAVHESLPLALNLPGSPRVRGSLVAYAEGLETPRWQVTPALNQT